MMYDKFDNHDIVICGKKRCRTCCKHNFKPVFESTVTRKKYLVVNHTPNPLTCSSSNVIDLVTCSRCGVQYVGETGDTLRKRYKNHRCTIRNKKMTLFAEYFSADGSCDISHITV